MSYKIWGLIIFIIPLCFCYSDLTLLNCPAQFNVQASNVTIDASAISLGSFIYSAYQSQKSISRVQKIVITGNTSDLESYTHQLMIPYIIFGVIFIIVFIFLVVTCLFDKSCPPCEYFRRDFHVNPYTTKQKRVAMISTLVFALGVLIICIISFSFIPKMKNNLALTSCSIYLTIDSAINGDGTWGGFINLRDQVGNITNLLSSAVTQMQIYFTADSWLVDTMTQMQQANLNIYKDYKSSQMITPNPSTTQTAANAQQSTPMIDSLFIKTKLGPNGTAGTMVSDIDSGLRTTAKLSNQAYKIQYSANILAGSVNTIVSNSGSSQNTLLMYINQLSVMSTQFGTLATSYFNDKFSTGLSVFQGVFAFALTGSLLILLGLISTHIFDLLVCRKMVHLGWAIYGVSYIGIIAITFVVLSLGSVGYNFCGYFDLMLNNQAEFKKLNAAYTQNAFNRLDVCLFGDGNSLQKFSIAQEMLTVTNLFTNIQTYYSYTNTQNSDYVDLTISTTKLTNWINAIKDYKKGITVDYDPTFTSDDNPNYAIKTLNLYTYQGGNVPTGSKDVWVWDSSLCGANQIVYTAGALPNNTFSTSLVTCLSFNQKLMINSPSIWTISDFTSRYVQVRNNYSAAYAKISFYAPTLIAYRDSRINLFQGIQDTLTSIYQQNVNFNALLNGFKGRVNQFYASVSTLNNLITNPLTGLLVSSNCKNLGDKMRFTYNLFCVNFMAQIIKLCFCSLALLILMLGGVCMGSRFGIIYAQVEKEERINQPTNEIASQKDIHLDEAMNKTESSKNSDDD